MLVCPLSEPQPQKTQSTECVARKLEGKAPETPANLFGIILFLFCLFLD